MIHNIVKILIVYSVSQNNKYRGWLISNIISHLKQKLWVGEISILIEFIYKFIGLSFNTD